MNNRIINLLSKYIVALPLIALYLYFITNIPNYFFRDRVSYELYALSKNSFYRFQPNELAYYFNEPLFINISYLFNDQPKVFPLILSSVISLIYMSILLKKSRNIILFVLGFLLLLFNTFLIYPQVMQMRQGLATALFLVIITQVKQRKFRILFACILPFIHVVFFLLTPIYIYYEIKLKNKDKIIIVQNIALLTLAFSLSYKIIGGLLGIRQVDDYQSGASLGGSFVVHLFLFLYLIFIDKTYSDNKDLYNLSIIGITIYLFSYFLAPAAGRIFISVYPFIIYYLVSKSKVDNYIILIAFNIVFIMFFFQSGLDGMLTRPSMDFYRELSKVSIF